MEYIIAQAVALKYVIGKLQYNNYVNRYIFIMITKLLRKVAKWTSNNLFLLLLLSIASAD